jgi:hypothetical protein
MTCPYCAEPLNHGATVCKSCQRDVALVMTLKEANHTLEQRVEELEAELAELREHGAPPLEPVEEVPKAPPSLFDQAMIYLVVPIVVLVGIHYLLVIKFDAKLYWLRAASIALPAAFGWLVEHRLRPRWFVTLGLGIVVGLAAVFGMSTMVHFTDGDPILPNDAVSWRETLEYATSIALGYLLGALLAFAAQPLASPGKRQPGAVSKLAGFLAVRVLGKKGMPMEARIQRAVMLIKIAASASTAIGAVYTGFKGIL